VRGEELIDSGSLRVENVDLAQTRRDRVVLVDGSSREIRSTANTFGERASVNAVGLDIGVADRADLHRVCVHELGDVRLEDPGDARALLVVLRSTRSVGARLPANNSSARGAVSIGPPSRPYRRQRSRPRRSRDEHPAR
jgi:hypothetical protein